MSLVHHSSALSLGRGQETFSKRTLAQSPVCRGHFLHSWDLLFHSLSWLCVRGTEGFLFLGEMSMFPGLFLGYRRHPAQGLQSQSLPAQTGGTGLGNTTSPLWLQSAPCANRYTHDSPRERCTLSLDFNAGTWSLSGTGRKLPLVSARTYGCHLKFFRDVNSRHPSHTANLWKAVLWLAFVIQSPFQIHLLLVGGENYTQMCKISVFWNLLISFHSYLYTR